MAKRRRGPRQSASDDDAGAWFGGLLIVGFLVWMSTYPGGGWILPTVGAVLLGLGLIWAAPRLWRLRRRRQQPKRPGGPIATSRVPIPAGLRFAVLRRDGFRCAYCGRGEGDGVRLHIDHLVPVARGGKNEIENLVTACQDCNLGKSAQDLIGV